MDSTFDRAFVAGDAEVVAVSKEKAIFVLQRLRLLSSDTIGVRIAMPLLTSNSITGSVPNLGG